MTQRQHVRERLGMLVATVAIGLALGACGSPEEAEVCPEITGEEHVAMATAEPGGMAVMLHLVGRSCPVVGSNRFAIYPMAAMDGMDDMDGEMQMAPWPAMAMATDVTFEVRSVAAAMPSMGHGTATPPELDPEQPNAFTVAFQMPGAWELTVRFATPTTTTEQEAVFAIEVH